MKKNLLKKLFALSLVVAAATASLSAMEAADAADASVQNFLGDVRVLRQDPRGNEGFFKEKGVTYSVLARQDDDPAQQAWAWVCLGELYMHGYNVFSLVGGFLPAFIPKIIGEDFEQAVSFLHFAARQTINKQAQVCAWLALGNFYKSDKFYGSEKKFAANKVLARLYFSRVALQTDPDLALEKTLAEAALVRLGGIKPKLD